MFFTDRDNVVFLVLFVQCLALRLHEGVGEGEGGGVSYFVLYVFLLLCSVDSVSTLIMLLRGWSWLLSFSLNCCLRAVSSSSRCH